MSVACADEHERASEVESRVPEHVAQRELEIQMLEDQFETTGDPDILADLNELKMQAAAYWTGTRNGREKARKYAADIYDYYKDQGDEVSLTNLRKVLFPMGYTKFDGFLGDEQYLTYPHDLSRLTREKVIVKTDATEKVSKVYWYDDKGALQRIHLPQENMTLFVGR